MSHIKKLHALSIMAHLLSRKNAFQKLNVQTSHRLKNFVNNNKLGRHNCISPKLGCSQCGYRTNLPHRMKRHEQLHRKKTVHQCSQCPYSAKRHSEVYSHMKNCHQSSSNNQDEEWHYPLNGGARQRIQSCGDCDYKAIRSSLAKHARRMHPSSASALPPIPPTKYVYQCAECEYETKQKGHFDRHRFFHDEKSAHQCPHCSFSVRSMTKLTIHVKHYHTKIDKKALVNEKHLKKLQHMDEHNDNNKIGNQLNTKNERDNNRVSSLSSRSSILSCQDCDRFKTTSRFTLKRHLKKTHPFSLSALPPQSNKSKHPLKKSGVKVDQEAHQTASKGTREEWYIPPSGIRKRYIYCADCDYRTTTRTHLNLHVKAKHPSSIFPKAARRNHRGPIQKLRGKEDSLIDSSVKKSLMDRHISQPNKKSQGQSEMITRKRFGIKECRVMLHNIQPLVVKVVNPENTKLIPSPDEESDQITDGDENKIHLLQVRIKTMEEKAQIAEEEVKEISSKKMYVRKRINKIEGRRALIECDLRSEQRNLLEIGISALNTEEDHSGVLLLDPVEEKVKSLNCEMDIIDRELGALKEEEKSLAQDLEDAQGSHFGVIQVLEALQSELDGLLLLNIGV